VAARFGEYFYDLDVKSIAKILLTSSKILLTIDGRTASEYSTWNLLHPHNIYIMPRVTDLYIHTPNSTSSSLDIQQFAGMLKAMWEQ